MSAIPDRGVAANYIPELANINLDQFAIAIAFNDGVVISAGDKTQKFSIQSVSKVFTLAIALGKIGDQLWTRVGREPSGQAFNSIIQLEHEKGIPRNPFINAGAIVTTDALLGGSTPRDTLASIIQFIRTAADDMDIFINEKVAKSEISQGHRNFSLAHFLKSYGNLNCDPQLTLGTYFHHCAIEMNVEQLAKAGLFLSGQRNLISAERVRRINALMLTCGHYDGSGDYAFRVGLPGKSGVGGGILSVVPNIGSVAVWSPGLNEYGNSKLGTEAMQELVRATGWSIF